MEAAPDADFPPAIHELAFDSQGHRLAGIIYTANGPGPHPTVVLLHGFPGNEKNLDLAQVMRRAGFNVLFFHYRGAWGSQGDYSILGVDDDALAALDQERARAGGDDPRLLRETGHARVHVEPVHGSPGVQRLGIVPGQPLPIADLDGQRKLARQAQIRGPEGRERNRARSRRRRDTHPVGGSAFRGRLTPT